jgi:hypothetical protein
MGPGGGECGGLLSSKKAKGRQYTFLTDT